MTDLYLAGKIFVHPVAEVSALLMYTCLARLVDETNIKIIDGKLELMSIHTMSCCGLPHCRNTAPNLILPLVCRWAEWKAVQADTIGSFMPSLLESPFYFSYQRLV